MATVILPARGAPAPERQGSETASRQHGMRRHPPSGVRPAGSGASGGQGKRGAGRRRPRRLPHGRRADVRGHPSPPAASPLTFSSASACWLVMSLNWRLFSIFICETGAVGAPTPCHPAHRGPPSAMQAATGPGQCAFGLPPLPPTCCSTPRLLLVTGPLPSAAAPTSCLCMLPAPTRGGQLDLPTTAQS